MEKDRSNFEWLTERSNIQPQDLHHDKVLVKDIHRLEDFLRLVKCIKYSFVFSEKIFMFVAHHR